MTRPVIDIAVAIDRTDPDQGLTTQTKLVVRQTDPLTEPTHIRELAAALNSAAGFFERVVAAVEEA